MIFDARIQVELEAYMSMTKRTSLSFVPIPLHKVGKKNIPHRITRGTKSNTTMKKLLLLLSHSFFPFILYIQISFSELSLWLAPSSYWRGSWIDLDLLGTLICCWHDILHKKPLFIVCHLNSHNSVYSKV